MSTAYLVVDPRVQCIPWNPRETPRCSQVSDGRPWLTFPRQKNQEEQSTLQQQQLMNNNNTNRAQKNSMMMMDPNNTHYNLHPPKHLLKHDEEVLEWRWKLLKYSIFAHKNSKPATIHRRRWWWDWGEGAGRNRQRRHIIEIIARHSRLGHKKYSREQQSLIHYILRRESIHQFPFNCQVRHSFP